MSTIAGSVLSRTSGAFNQLQQRLNDNLSLDNLQSLTKQVEGQFPQIVNDALPGWGDNGQANPSNSPNPSASPKMPVPTPAYLAYYGYGRPLGGFYQASQIQAPPYQPSQNSSRMSLLSNQMPVPVYQPAVPVIQTQMRPQPVGYAAPIGYTNRGPAQTDPTPSQWYS